MFDDIGNFGIGVIQTPPSPATSGTTIVLASGQGANFPAIVNGFDALVWPNPATLPTKTNAEIVRVTHIAGDIFTITRAQEGSTARAIQQGDYITLHISKKMIQDIINNFSNYQPVGNYQPLASNLTSYAGKTPPSGAVVGTSDSQILTNKTIDYNANTIQNLPLPTGTDGWVAGTDTLVYVSANSFKIAGANRTTIYQKGTRIKFTNNSITYYGTVIASSFTTDTTVTLAPNNDFSINNSAITNPSYSYAASPQGYPDWFNYTPTYSGFNTMTWTSITTNIAKFRIVGKSITVVVAAEGTTGGTATNALIFSVPVNADLNSQQGYRAAGSVDDGTGLSGFGLYVNGTISMGRYDNANFGLGGARGVFVAFAYGY